MAYTPPLGNDADFEIVIYTAPAGNSANFNLSGVASSERNSEIAGVVAGSSEINSEVIGGGTITQRSSEAIGKLAADTEITSQIIGKIPLFIPVTYRILVRDENGVLLGEFEKFRELSFGKKLNDYGTASFQILATDDKAATLISLRRYTIEIYRQKDADSVLVWAGEQAMRQGDLENGKNNWCTIYCYDWLEQLRSRYTVFEKVYGLMDAGDIAWDLIDTTQNDGLYGDFGITLGTIEATVDRERTYHNENVMDAIISLANMASGFDFEITLDKVFNVKAVIGEDKSDSIVLEYGTNIDSARITEDFVRPSNRAIVLGNAIGEEELQRVEVDDLASQAIYKLREYPSSEMDEQELDSFTDRGEAINRKYGAPLVKADITLRKSSSPSIVDFSLGDGVRLIINSGIYAIDSQYRVFEWEVKFDDDNAEKLSLILGNFTYE